MTSENVGTLVFLRMADRVWVRMFECRSTDTYKWRYKGWHMDVCCGGIHEFIVYS